MGIFGIYKVLKNIGLISKQNICCDAISACFEKNAFNKKTDYQKI